jgi:hypothetical protein
MAYITEVTHTQTTTGNRDFSVTFPFMSTTDLRVQLAGVTKSLNTDYTIVQSGANTVVNFNTAPANGATIRIFRDTDIDNIESTFVAGSSIRSTDLNNNNTQLLYAAQEFGTLKTDNSVSFSLGDKGDIQINSSSDWQLQNNVVENANMADNSVGNNELIDGSITGGKLASLSITTSQIAANAVNADKLASNAVTSAKLADDAVTTAKINDDAIDPTKISQTNAAGYGFTPPGAVIWYAGNSAPTGYLKANGDSIPNGSGNVQGISADFSGLYAIVGGNLPDLRGEFIRAWSDGRNVDSSRALRSTQTDDTVAHSHSASMGSTGAHSHDSTTTSTTGNHSHRLGGRKWNSVYDDEATSLHGGHANPQDSDAYSDTAGSHSHTVSVTSAGSNHTHSISIANSSGGTETRPRNVALLACIKY